MPVARGPWALDSGGFTELSMFGEWRTSLTEYVEDVYRCRDEIGHLEWAAPQDWMCEPHIIEKTGQSVAAHQHHTTQNYLDLRAAAPDLPFVPVLQGWTYADYVAHAELYASAGVDLPSLWLVGIGSVCRRQQTQGGREVIQHFARRSVRLHAFGLKLNGLRECAWMLSSSDSLAWSYRARRAGTPMLASCTHRACSNCMPYALKWREQVLRTTSIQQPDLGLEVCA